MLEYEICGHNPAMHTVVQKLGGTVIDKGFNPQYRLKYTKYRMPSNVTEREIQEAYKLATG